MKDRILKLLIAGYKASDIASVVGCSPAYVSQLLKEDEFIQAVEAGRIASAKADDEEKHLENRYQRVKHKILNNIEETLTDADLPQLVRALEVVDKVEDNTKKRKMPVPQGTGVINGNVHITNIQLPAHALAAPAPVVSINEKNEIIAIDNKPLAPMSSDGVKNIFARLAARNQEQKVIAEL